MKNFCLIVPTHGPISVRITVNNGIRSKSIFFLGKPNDNGGYTVVERFKDVITGDDGKAVFSLNTPADQLQAYVLAWSIDSCSMIPQVEKGRLKVEFFQNGKKCKTSKSTTYGGKFPQCSDGKTRMIRKQVAFVFEPNLQENALWKEIK